MAECRDLEELLAPYVDGEAQAVDCAAIDAHLRTCPACRTRVSCERAVREALVARRDRIRPSAPLDLRRRCAAAHALPAQPAGLPAGAARRRSSWVPLSMAASILLAFAGVFFYGLRGGGPALAAQLVADHVRCFAFEPQPTIIPDGLAKSREWAATRGWDLKVPPSTDTEQLKFLDIRRCISSDAVTAHILYKWRGEPLSVYVMSRQHPRIGPTPELVEQGGQEAFMWSKNNRTYAVVARGRPADVEQVARYVQIAAE